jgi:hypothetical protein
MVRAVYSYELAEKLFEHFQGRCVLIWEIRQYAGRLGYNPAPATVLNALKYLVANNKVHMYKLYRAYAVYCFGKEYNAESLLDHKEVRKCIEENLSSFRFSEVIECLVGRKSIGHSAILYLSVLYELMKMLKERKMRYFIVTTDRQNGLKVVIDREITAEDLQRKA